MAPLGGIEPHAFHPTLRTSLEDWCRAQWYYLKLFSDSEIILYYN